MKIKAYLLNVFAKTEQGGNPAGVVPYADSLSDKDMQKIATELNVSETAFLQSSESADYKLRFFTPTSEIDLCGHATIAAFSLLAKIEQIKKQKYSVETKSGIIIIESEKDQKVFMNLKPPEFFETLDGGEVAKTLNISEEELGSDLPVQIISTGVKDILVPIKNLKSLLSLKPDFAKISELSKKHNVAGCHLFCMETKFGSTAHCRNFAPLYGIPEESATGTSSGTLACYLLKYGKISEEKTKNIIFEQGYSMNKPSEIIARVIVENKKISAIQIGGLAAVTKEIEVDI